jgi:dihydrofolate reductase
LNIILTRDAGFSADGGTVVHSPEEALEAARESGASECFIIGGAELYKLYMPLLEQLYLTYVHTKVTGDTYMPPIGTGWHEVWSERHDADAKNPHAYTFILFKR